MNGPPLPFRAALAAALAIAVALAASCVSTAEPGTSLSVGGGISAIQAERTEIERLLARGSPSSLEEAVDLAGRLVLVTPEETAAYRWLAYEMARLVYPEMTAALPANVDAPSDDPLVKAFLEARNGRATAPAAGSSALYELFPALAVFRLNNVATSSAALAATERFASFDLPSAVAGLARGMALERTGDRVAALAAYAAAMELAPDCYPAVIGRGRILVELGRPEEALTACVLQPPLDTMLAYQRVRARALYGAGLWDEALPLVTAILLKDPMDSRSVLIRAHLLVERGEYKQAAPLLDAYASVDPYDRLYILLRARTALESSRDRSAAVAALRRGLERYPDDRELVLYAAEVFSAGDARERSEAVVLAGRALGADPSSARALKVLLAADLQVGNLADAADKADRLLVIDPAYSDYESLYRAYRGVGRTADATWVAQAWYARQPGSESAAVAMATVMVESSPPAEARDFIAVLLARGGSSAWRSTLFWLQSRVQDSRESSLASLRAALVENGMNVDALVAMADVYIADKDYQHARFYLKQALSLSPDRPDIAERRNTLAQQGVAIP